MRLFELFDNPIVDIKWGEDIMSDTADFDIGEYHYQVEFVYLPSIDFIQEAERDGDKIPDELRDLLMNNAHMIDIGFTLKHKNWTADPTYDITGTGNEIQVFSTVIGTINKFLTNANVDLLHISSKEASRTRLYQRMVNTLAKGKKVWSLYSPEHKQTYWIIKV